MDACPSFTTISNFADTDTYKDHVHGSEIKGLWMASFTQNLTCMKHVDLLLASNVINVNYQIRMIHRNICKD